MLAEKFFLVLEALIKGQSDRLPTYSDGAPRVVSSSVHVPVVLKGAQSIPRTQRNALAVRC